MVRVWVKLVALLFSLYVYAANAQIASEQYSFDVASIKPANSGWNSKLMQALDTSAQEAIRFRGGPGTKQPGRLDYSGVTLRMLIKRAYDIQAEEIFGPDWIDDERYDVVATLPRGTTTDQCRLMLQELLTERFKVRLHREGKTLSVYRLIVSKKGVHLQPAETPVEYQSEEDRKAAMKKKAEGLLAQASHERGPSRSFSIPNATMEVFAARLSSLVDKPVIDRTGVSGTYSFSLKWAPEGIRSREDVPIGPSIFAALEEQMGLKLESAREETKSLVIDYAEKVPTGN